jgi:IS1 family transposase
VLTYVLTDRLGTAFVQLKAILELFGIQQFYTDDWGAYERYLAAPARTVGKGKLIVMKACTLCNESESAKAGLLETECSLESAPPDS